MKPKALILRTAGTNCDQETRAAFELAGAAAERVHINLLISGEKKLDDYQILAVPGGFSYGDDIASGKILANELRNKLGDGLREFALRKKPVIGICNGFQVLVKMGLLPDPKSGEVTATLTFNDSDKFECRWIYLGRNKEKGADQKCLWTKGMPEVIPLPVAHGEGKFVTVDGSSLNALEEAGQIVFRYVTPAGEKAAYPENPNGAVNAIAGICNKDGNVFGLMPHPERYAFRWQHPSRIASGNGDEGWGLTLFRNAVTFAAKG